MIATIQLIALLLLPSFNNSPAQEDNPEDIKKVEAAIVNWADTSLKKHLNYKFENYKAFYTDDYFIQSMRLENYQDKINTLKAKKEAGEYKGTDDSFNADIAKLTKALNNAKETINKIDKVSYFQTSFWTNILTNDGVSVYYELIMKVDNDFNVIEATENSSIGKKDATAKIAYQSADIAVRVTEK